MKKIDKIINESVNQELENFLNELDIATYNSAIELATKQGRIDTAQNIKNFLNFDRPKISRLNRIEISKKFEKCVLTENQKKKLLHNSLFNYIIKNERKIKNINDGRFVKLETIHDKFILLPFFNIFNIPLALTEGFNKKTEGITTKDILSETKLFAPSTFILLSTYCVDDRGNLSMSWFRRQTFGSYILFVCTNNKMYNYQTFEENPDFFVKDIPNQIKNYGRNDVKFCTCDEESSEKFNYLNDELLTGFNVKQIARKCLTLDEIAKIMNY